jgi:hypothetical protein
VARGGATITLLVTIERVLNSHPIENFNSKHRRAALHEGNKTNTIISHALDQTVCTIAAAVCQSLDCIRPNTHHKVLSGSLCAPVRSCYWLIEVVPWCFPGEIFVETGWGHAGARKLTEKVRRDIVHHRCPKSLHRELKEI